MKKTAPILVAVLSTLVSSPWADCVPATAQLDRMARAQLRVLQQDRPTRTLSVRIADEADEQAAGFQHICPENIKRTAIWFDFHGPIRSAFHMFNVHGPLDIAFLDGTGRVMEVRRMEPYTTPRSQGRLHGAGAPFHYALEAPAGRFDALGIRPGTRLTLE